MIHPDDIAAWIAQVRQYPEAAPGIIEALASRLVALDQQNEALRDELVRFSRSREPDAGQGRLAALSRRIQALERQLEHGAQSGASVPRSLLVLTLDGRGARLALPQVSVWNARNDPQLVIAHLRPRHLLIVADTDDLLLFSDKGRAIRLAAAEVGSTDAPINYLSLLPNLVLDLDEAISVAVSFPATFDRLTLVTRKGYARSFRHAEADSLLERNMLLHSSPIEGDYPAFALFSDGKGEVVIATRMGKGVRFPEGAVGVQSKPAINLDRGDVVVGAAVIQDKETLALVGAEGVAARREIAGLGAHSTAGNRGKLLTRIKEIAAVAPVTAKDVLWLLTTSGQLHAVPVAKAPSGPGASSGRMIVTLGEDRVVALAIGSAS